MFLKLALVDDENTVLVRGTVDAMADASGSLYATSYGEGYVVRSGVATAVVIIVAAGLLKVKTILTEPVSVNEGQHVVMPFHKNGLIAEIVGAVVDPLEIEPF